MRTFKLKRLEDVSGISGTGLIAEGVEFHDGQIVLSWFGQHHTIEVAPNISDVMAIHGHGGKTILEWDAQKSETCYRTHRLLKYLHRARLGADGTIRIPAQRKEPK